MSAYNDMARELGLEILKSEESINLADLKAMYENDIDAKKKMNNYEEFRNTMQENTKNNEISQEDYKIASQKLAAMVVELKQDPTIGAMLFAEKQYNDLVNGVMNVLKATITGSTCNDSGPGGCGGCSGSCK